MPNPIVNPLSIPGKTSFRYDPVADQNRLDRHARAKASITANGGRSAPQSASDTTPSGITRRAGFDAGTAAMNGEAPQVNAYTTPDVRHPFDTGFFRSRDDRDMIERDRLGTAGSIGATQDQRIDARAATMQTAGNAGINLPPARVGTVIDRGESQAKFASNNAPAPGMIESGPNGSKRMFIRATEPGQGLQEAGSARFEPPKTGYEWHGEIMAKHPQIGVKDSPENKAFVAAYNTAMQSALAGGEEVNPHAIADAVMKPKPAPIAHVPQPRRLDGSLNPNGQNDDSAIPSGASSVPMGQRRQLVTAY